MKLEFDSNQLGLLDLALHRELEEQLRGIRFHRKEAKNGSEWLSFQTHQEARIKRTQEAIELRCLYRRVNAAWKAELFSSIDAPTETPSATGWNKGEAPHDREVVIIANLCGGNGDEFWAEPVCCRAQWNEQADCWCFSSHGLSIRQDITDRLNIIYWSDVPTDDPQLASAVTQIEQQWQKGTHDEPA